MSRSYSVYEAKAKFSDLLRKVRSGQNVIITYRGEEIAEIRPVAATQDIESRIRMAEERGTVWAAEGRGRFPKLATRPGGLSRFLESRD
jgi:prevent-host-death family protein